jgi:RNA-directed DNA polymerase
VRALPLLVTNESKERVVRAMARELDFSAEDQQLALQLFGNGLPPLSSIDCIPFLFGVSPKLIGRMRSHGDRYYRRFYLRKRSGGLREIVTPRRFLKVIQRWLLEHIFEKVELPSFVNGFVKGRDIFQNARSHCDNRNVLVMDLADFFPTVTEFQVYRALRGHFAFPKGVASQLAGLCTLDGRLPQGAPTSPALANIVFRECDLHLNEIAEHWRCTYTRYADDLAFSGGERFSRTHVEQIAEQVVKHGFRVNWDKVRIAGPGSRQLIAGIIVNEVGYPKREIRRRWRAMFHRADKHPREFKHRIDELSGIAAFVHQFDPQLATGYRATVSQLLSTGI